MQIFRILCEQSQLYKNVICMIMNIIRGTFILFYCIAIRYWTWLNILDDFAKVSHWLDDPCDGGYKTPTKNDYVYEIAATTTLN